MTEFVVKAIGMGIALAMLPGPAFFILLQTSIKNGVRSAMAFDFGVLIADIVYILIAYLFFSEVTEFASQKGYLHIIGGFIFLIFGVSFFVNIKMKSGKKMRKTSKDLDPNTDSSYLVLFFKGLLLNGFNPFVIFYWLGVITVGAESTDADHMLWFLSIILITFFSIDALKIFGAKSLQKFITPSFLKNLNRFVGIAFIIFGIFAIGSGVNGVM